MNPDEQVRRAVDDDRDELVALSHAIHADAETAFEEFVSSERVATALSDRGFTVEVGVADLPTAFTAEIGSGSLVIGLCAEYDALAGVGHACGHNIIAASAVGAAAALAPLVDDLDVTIRVLGTPAEEGGSGKIYMLRAGSFDGLHAAMMVHPAPYDGRYIEALAAQAFTVDYTGRSSHASAAPELGINAADALTIAQVAIGLLRQHVRPVDRIHGIVTHAGDAANVIPDHASGRWYGRSTTLDDLSELLERVQRCFEAGAVATGTTLKLREPHPARSEFRDATRLSAMYLRAAADLGRDFTVFDRRGPIRGSTDMANVSLVMPAIHPMIGIDAGGASLHSREFAARAISGSADRAVRDGAVGLARTVVGAAVAEAVRLELCATSFVAATTRTRAF